MTYHKKFVKFYGVFKTTNNKLCIKCIIVINIDKIEVIQLIEKFYFSNCNFIQFYEQTS